jgi:hypothetical protein
MDLIQAILYPRGFALVDIRMIPAAPAICRECMSGVVVDQLPTTPLNIVMSVYGGLEDA